MALGVGSGVAIVIVVIAAATVWRARSEPSPIAGPDEGRRFGIIVGIEFTLAVVAALVGVATSVSPSSVAGLGVGTALAAHAASLLVAARRLRGAVTDRMPA